jgi:hypothetical protein
METGIRAKLKAKEFISKAMEGLMKVNGKII